MVAAAARIPAIDRRDCRAHMEAHFSVAAMANSYERVYHMLISDRLAPSNQVGATEVARPPDPLSMCRKTSGDIR